MFCDKFKPQILMLSETCVTEDIFDSEIAIIGYNLLRCDSNSRHTGGLAVYTKSGIRVPTISSCQKDLSWFMAVKVLSGFTKGVYDVIYKSPQERNKNFIDIFDDWCSEFFDSENNLNVICGDFNTESCFGRVGLKIINYFSDRVGSD
jgi:hypothetical protein